jgi:hypothetical protein
VERKERREEKKEGRKEIIKNYGRERESGGKEKKERKGEVQKYSYFSG